MPKYPFEATLEELQSDTDAYIDSVFSSLESAFLVLPKGPGFVDYGTFETGYETLKKATAGFTRVSSERVLPTVLAKPVTFVVLRTMLGFTLPELAYVTSESNDIIVDQGFARTWDRRARLSPMEALAAKGTTMARLSAMVDTACRLLKEGAPAVGAGLIHRLDKADTKGGLPGVRTASQIGVPYAMLLYERFLGRPFAAHRDSVSELVGDVLETAVENELSRNRISSRKTKRAESVPGFDQVPDFLVPSEHNPSVVIEAKLTEDDGTARDKVTRIQHLRKIAEDRGSRKRPAFQVLACIDGRGFRVRRQDMKKLLLATNGKVYTLKTLGKMVESSDLSRFRTEEAGT